MKVEFETVQKHIIKRPQPTVIYSNKGAVQRKSVDQFAAWNRH